VVACSHCQMGDAAYPHPVAGRAMVCGDCYCDFAEHSPALLTARRIEQDIKVERRARDMDRAGMNQGGSR